MRNIFLTSMLIAASASGYASTESADSITEDFSNLEELVVTGTRVLKPLKDSPVQTRLISAKDIQRTDATDIRDLLQQAVPGVEFSYAMD